MVHIYTFLSAYQMTLAAQQLLIQISGAIARMFELDYLTVKFYLNL